MGKRCEHPTCRQRCSNGRVAYNRGQPMSEEQKLKISISRKGKMLGNTFGFKKGQEPWNKGKPHLAGEANPFFGKTHSQEVRAKISEKLRGNPRTKGSFKTGHVPWNKGLAKDTDDRLLKTSRSMKQHIKTCGKHRVNPTWLTPENRRAAKSCAEGCTCKKHLRTSAPWSLGNKHTLGRTPWNKGLTKDTDERVKKYTESLKRHLEACDGGCGGGACNSRSPSGLAWKLVDFLTSAGFDNLVVEAKFGPYSIDALLADEWIAFEADGEYWHSVNRTDYEARDAYLLNEHDLVVVRLTENEIKEF